MGERGRFPPKEKEMIQRRSLFAALAGVLSGLTACTSIGEKSAEPRTVTIQGKPAEVFRFVRNETTEEDIAAKLGSQAKVLRNLPGGERLVSWVTGRLVPLKDKKDKKNEEDAFAVLPRGLVTREPLEIRAITELRDGKHIVRDFRIRRFRLADDAKEKKEKKVNAHSESQKHTNKAAQGRS